MERASSYASLVSLLLLCVTGGLIFGIEAVEDRGLASVFALILGVFVYQIVEFLHVAVGGAIRQRHAVHYDRSVIELASNEIKTVPDSGHTEDAQVLEKETTDIRSLFFEDPNLALAKLRMELEQELKLTAEAFDITDAGRYLGVGRMASAMRQEKVISPSVEAAIREVADVCNKAIHGYDIDHEQARGILTSGEELMFYMRLIRKNGLHATQ